MDSMSSRCHNPATLSAECQQPCQEPSNWLAMGDANQSAYCSRSGVRYLAGHTSGDLSMAGNPPSGWP